MTKRLTKLAGISAISIAFGLTIPAVAVAVPPPVALTCGSTVTGPVALSANLVCSGDAITLLGGSLDLRHHTISGDGTGTGVTLGTVADDFSSINATVENGTITNFATGLATPSGGGLQHLNIRSVSITHSYDGVLGTGVNNLLLDDVILTDEADIAVLADHTAVIVTHATIAHSGTAFFITNGGAVTASNLKVADNAKAGVCSQGLLRVKGSQFTGNAAGVDLFQCEGSLFTDSVFANNGFAAISETQGFDNNVGPTLIVRDDHFQGNLVGIHLSDQAMAVSISKSVFTLNGTGIAMDECAPTDAPCLPIVDQFTSNRFAQNHGNGVTWGDGTVTMTSNQFQTNSGWGFFAEPTTTVVDGGGNKAQGNHAGGCDGGLVCS